MYGVERLSAEEAKAILPQLIALLQDVVHNGASVGFLPPVARETAEEYWLECLREVEQGQRFLLAAREGEEVIGSVQLALSAKQNGSHRAEVQKLIVSTRHRRRGVARALMSRMEEAARAAGRTLLVLDTEKGSGAEQFYAECGYTRAGSFPQFARDTSGKLRDNVLFYRLL